MVRRNAEMVQDQDEYNRSFDALTARCETLKEQQRKISEQLAEKVGRKMKLEAFVEKIRNTDGLTGFDEQLFTGTIDKVVVSDDKDDKVFVFCFKDGTEIAVGTEGSS